MRYEQYLPEVYVAVEEFRALGGGMDGELVAVREKIEQFPYEMLVTTAGEEGITRWEEMLGLAAKGDLENRRFRILSRLNARIPYTIEQLRRQLAAVFGDNERFLIRLEDFQLGVEVPSKHESALAGLTDELRQMIPANLILKTAVTQFDAFSQYSACVMRVSDWLNL